MKTKINLTARMLLFATLLFLFSINKVSSQGFYNNPSPPETEIQSLKHFFNLTYNPSGGSPGSEITGVGINQDSPLYMLDILGNPDPSVNTKEGVNVASRAYGSIPANFYAGYRVGGYGELYTYGIVEDVFLGYLAGHDGSGITGPTVQYNTVLGYSAGYNIDSWKYTTLVGAYAGYSLSNSSGSYGWWNTMVGIDAGYYGPDSYGCNYYGKCAGFHCDGYRNCMYGSHAGDGSGGAAGTWTYASDSNAFFGNWSAYNFTAGGSNVMMGNGAGLNTASYLSGKTSWCNVFIGNNAAQMNPGGNYNIVIGRGADAYTILGGGGYGTITNAAAIGADAVVNYDNEFIIGNNAQSSGIGMVGEGFPLGKLEVFQHSGTTNTIGEFVTNTDLSSITA